MNYHPPFLKPLDIFLSLLRIEFKGLQCVTRFLFELSYHLDLSCMRGGTSDNNNNISNNNSNDNKQPNCSHTLRSGNLYTGHLMPMRHILGPWPTHLLSKAHLYIQHNTFTFQHQLGLVISESALKKKRKKEPFSSACAFVHLLCHQDETKCWTLYFLSVCVF